MQAAKDLFLEKGFSGTSIDAVAKKAGVSKLTVYSHYEGKDDLFRKCIGHCCQEMGVSGDISPLFEMSAKEALTTVGKRFLNLILDPEVVDMHRVIVAEAARWPKNAELFMQSGPEPTIANVTRLIEHLVERGELEVESARRAAGQFLSLLHGMLHMRVVMTVGGRPTEGEVEEHVGECVGLFLRGYGGGEGELLIFS